MERSGNTGLYGRATGDGSNSISETQGEPLVIEDISSLRCVYPAQRAAIFESDSKELQQIWDAAWRTLALNAQETFISDIAWERLQYVADTKVQALTWLNLTGDDRLVRIAIEDFDASRVPFGLTQARYPGQPRTIYSDVLALLGLHGARLLDLPRRRRVHAAVSARHRRCAWMVGAASEGARRPVCAMVVELQRHCG